MRKLADFSGILARMRHSNYVCAMLRALTSFFWLIAALALGFESVAQPCELAAERHAPSQTMITSEMPCHDDMAAMQHSPEEAPKHHQQTCCCAALLGNGVTTTAPELSQPIPVLTDWTAPLPDFAQSIFLEFEPPPPRA